MKDEAARILLHQQSKYHKEVHNKLYILPGQTRNVGEILDSEHAVQKVENRKITKKYCLSCKERFSPER